MEAIEEAESADERGLRPTTFQGRRIEGFDCENLGDHQEGRETKGRVERGRIYQAIRDPQRSA